MEFALVSVTAVPDRNVRQLNPTVDMALDALRTLTGAQTQQTSVACDL
jgi:hypothetical protein